MSTEHFNQLTPAEAERLAILAEECAEVIQVVGKILRHGYASYNPNDSKSTTNRELLQTECGHVRYAIAMMCISESSPDLSSSRVLESFENKLTNIKPYLHHQ